MVPKTGFIGITMQTLSTNLTPTMNVPAIAQYNFHVQFTRRLTNITVCEFKFNINQRNTVGNNSVAMIMSIVTFMVYRTRTLLFYDPNTDGD